MGYVLSFTLRRFGFVAIFFIGGFLFSTGVNAADRVVRWPSAVVGVPYLQTFTSESGFPEPYTWEVSTSTVSDVLPSGLFGVRIGSRAIKVYGTPASPGVHQFTIAPRASDGALLPTTLVTLEVLADLPVPTIVYGAGSRSGSVGMPFSSETILKVEHGVAPYVWRMVGGGLPSGLIFTSEGAIQGTPMVSGVYAFQAEVSDAAGFRATKLVTVAVMEGEARGVLGKDHAVVPEVSPAIPVSHMSQIDRSRLLQQLGISVNTVLRTDYLDPLMLRPLHYYIGVDGRRHAFQSDAVYYSWFPGAVTDVPRLMSIQDMASIPMGEPVTYRPGERVRFRTDGQTYAVVDTRAIQPVDSGVDTSLWQKGVEELSETYFGMYRLLDRGGPLSHPAVIRSRYLSPGAVLSSR